MAVFTESLADVLNFIESTTPVYIAVSNHDVIEYLDIGQVVRYVLVPDPHIRKQAVTDTILVTATVGEAKQLPAAGTVTVTQTVARTIVRPKFVADTLTIAQFVAAVLSPRGQTNYGIIDVGTSNYDAGLTAPASITLTFVDPMSGSHTLTLRKPDFGDGDNYEATRIQRTNRGGDLQIFQDPTWPTTEILDFKFSYLDDPSDLLAFLTVSQGGLIDLHDHYGRHWKGFILTPEGQVVQPKRTTYTAAFKFQGVLQDS